MEKSCSECSEPTLVHSLCTLCNKWLCYQCTDVHQHHRAPATSQYTDMHEQQRTGAGGPASELHQRGSGSLPLSGQGTGSYPCSLLMCHSHRQEPLELFCESCDLLCCSSCHLSSHKTHRVVQIGKALQDQRWLFESLTVQVEERRSVVENNAKQIEDRVHEVKIAHRKAENQIKMAKMIMMNELNKRANLLIEQLEKISEDFQQRLEDQLQGAIDICGQLDHVQKFVTWAMAHHCRGPVLFSRTLISLQMQQLLESSLHSDSWSPVKIKFNWDASYWTKQISSLGQVTVEGGSCTHPQGLSCSSVIRPQPITCLSLPSVCHRGRESGCGYQAFCEPQMCCLHGIPSQPDLPSLDKSQLGASLYSSSCVAPSVHSSSLLQSQHAQRCWDKNSSSALQPSPQCPPSTSPLPVVGSVQLSCGHGPSSQLQSAASQPPQLPQHKSYLYHQHQRGSLPNGLAQPNSEQRCPGQGQTLSQSQEVLISAALQQELSCADVERGGTPEESWEERRAHGQTEHEQLLNEELQQDRREQPRTRTPLMLRDHRSGRRSTSLEVSMTAHEHGSDVQLSRISPSSVCTRRKRRSQSIPAELAAPAGSPYTERPTGCAHRQEAGAGNRCDSADPRQRRASDGVLCVVKESSSEDAFTRGSRSPLLHYKTEPDQSDLNEEADDDTKEKCRVSRDTHNSNRGIEKEAGRTRVPVVCLERLKILVSQLPPPGRRQSDPLPASSTETSNASIQKRTWHVTSDGAAGGSETRRTALLGSPYAERHTCAHSVSHGRLRSCKVAFRSKPHTGSMHDLDSDSDPRSVSQEADVSQEDQEHDRHLDSDASTESDPNTKSSSEGEFECPGEEKSLSAETMGSREGADLGGGSEPSLEYDVDPESASGAGSDEGQEQDAESADAETESDTQPEYDPRFQAETESDVSDQLLDSRGYVESEQESEADLRTDEPQPLRSDLEEESPVGPGQRPLLIANPTLQRGAEEVRTEQDSAEIESEDFCAVCLIGGDLLCCDRCPKVFHLSCHIPSLLSFPSGDWICSLCRNVVQPEVEYDCENERRSGECTSHHGLPACDRRKCEQLTLLILSNILSAPFHEPVSPLARHYYQIIKRPMDLSVIRAKLSKRNSQHYNSPDQFVADVYLMFNNCAKFNYPDSEVAQAGRSLEAFFTAKLEEVFPERVFQVAEVDSDSDEYDEACRTAEGGFPWPEKREQCHRKRKRRHSLKSRRHHF